MARTTRDGYTGGMTVPARKILVLAALLALSLPAFAQVRTVPGLVNEGIPTVPATIGVSPLNLSGIGLPVQPSLLPLSASVLSAMTPVLPLSVVPAVSVANAVVPVAAAKSAAVVTAGVEAKALNASALTQIRSAAGTDVTSVAAGRKLFDGSAAAGDEAASVPEAEIPARGEGFRFHGQFIPTRVFSDKEKPSVAILRAIDAAKNTIDLALHGLALRDTAAALIRAQKRGVKIRIVMNQTHVFPEKDRDRVAPEIEQLLAEGVEMRILRGGDEHGIMHNKFALFDGQIAQTGSYNWTHAADTWHWENVLFFNEPMRVAGLQGYWKWMWDKSLSPRTRPAPVVIGEDGHGPDVPAAPEPGLMPVTFNGQSFPLAVYAPKGIEQHVVRVIDAAKKTIDVANFSFTSGPLRDALIRAKARGVKVRLVFDEDQYAFLSEMEEMKSLGFDVRIVGGKDGLKGVQHNKFAVFDGELVQGGSYNWTTNAQRNNYENAVFLNAADDVKEFSAYFDRIRKKSRVPRPEDHDGGDRSFRPQYSGGF